MPKKKTSAIMDQDQAENVTIKKKQNTFVSVLTVEH